jgi:lipoprotein-releasing system ATP-binding protein
MNNLVEVKELRKSFGSGAGRVDVLKGVDLAIQPGETIALVGASGAGKSTLLHIMGALDRPTSGTVNFKGKDIFQLNDSSLASFRNHSVGFVFQFHHLLPEFSALENVMMPAIISGMNNGEAEALAVDLLGDVGLGHRLSHKPGELSGGEQQRVAIARALIKSPPLLLADEPTGNLDTKTSEEVHALLSDIHYKKGITLVIVTHNEALASRMGKIIRLVDGCIK